MSFTNLKRLIYSALCPFAAAILQWMLWDAYIKPYVWFLFFPAAFFSAWIGRLRGGLIGTAICAVLVWYVFIPPHFSFVLTQTSALYSIVLFVVMGGLFSWFFEQHYLSIQRTAEALAETEAANARISALYQKTLELDRLKSQFFANVSHELRTPLTLILAPLEQRLRRSGRESLPEAERRETQIMVRNAQLLYHNVSDLLDAAKLEAGRLKAEWSSLDVALLVKAMCSNFEGVANDRGISQILEVSEHLCVQGDAEKIQRILLNLLSNAFKFVPDHGQIIVRLIPAADCYRIEVQDNGPGIPASMHEAVFERFRQVEGDARRTKGGTGLGLAIVKEFGALLGGSVRVADSPGGGAWFIITLPNEAPKGVVLGRATTIDRVIALQAADEVRREPPAFEALPSSSDSRPLILVVEDNQDMRSFLVSVLQSQYRVASAASGQLGLDLARKLRPDLILTDLMMPLMTGQELAEAIWQVPGLKDVPIVVLTARVDDELKLRLLTAGVQEYLTKPFSTEELLTRIHRQITERQRNSERIAAIFEHSAIPMALATIEGQLLQVNPPLAKLLGFTLHELAHLTFLAITHPDDLKAGSRELERLVKGEIGSYSMEKRYLRKDKTIVWANVTIALVRKTSGEPDYLIKVIDDITASKELAQGLMLAKTAAEQANRAKSDFLANMSHEIRTPMNAVLGLTRLLGETRLDARQRDYLAKLDASARSLLGVLNDILGYAKIEAGKLDLEAVDFELAEILESTASLFSFSAEAKGLELVFDIAPNLPPMLVGDPLRLKQILNNLIGNAIKFTQHGFVALSMRALELKQDALILEVSVKDTGIGITPEQRGRLFRAFEQGDSSTTRQFGGTGLGLAISKNLVELMGGNISLQSEPGHGSTFTFTVSLKVSQAPSLRRTAAQLRGMRTLLVDDHEIACESLQHLMSALHFNVDVAYSGAEGLQKALGALQDKNPFELILVDWKLPDIDGIELARQLRREEALASANKRNAMIIMVTAHGRLEAQNAAQEVRFDAILDKPVVPRQIMDLIALLQASGPEDPAIEIGSDLRRGSERVQPIRGSSLLLVEDNLTTQQVACEILETLGFRVTLASNGQEAVARAAAQPFDAILMDLQMPQMGGIEATRRIRELPSGRDVPIIAMTAAVLLSDREACRTAGMNAFLSKPMDVTELVVILLRSIRPRPDVLPLQSNQTTQLLPGGTPFEVPGLALPEAALRMGGDWGMLRRAVMGFLRDFSDNVAQLEQRVADHQWGEALRLAHSVKGVAKTIGADTLHGLAQDLERELLDECSPSLQRYSAELNRHLQDIARLVPADSGVGCLPDPARTLAILEEMKDKLGRSVFVPLELVDELLQGLTSAKTQEQGKVLLSQVDLFDYPAALQTVKTLELACQLPPGPQSL